MLFYEIRHRQSGEALPEPIFRTETGAQVWLDAVKERVAAGVSMPFIGPVLEDALPVISDFYVAPASDVITDPSPDSPLEVVAEAMRQMWGRESVGIKLLMRARQIVEALQHAGHLQ